MTTNIHDKNRFIISSDSRWSTDINNKKEILFIDDLDFEKMVVTDEFAIVTAGDSRLIDAWKNWAKNDILSERPPVVLTNDGEEPSYISICLIFKPSIVLYDSQVATIVMPHARFSGSGREIARVCWSQNKCALQAIETAKSIDVYTGGNVKYANLALGDANLGSDLTTLDELNSAIYERGFIMDKSTKQITPLSEYNTRDSIYAGLKNGSIVALAPTGDAKSPWNSEQEKSLDAAISILRRLVTNKTKEGSSVN